MVTLISAKWREFLENNPNREAILDEEDRVVVPKPKPKEGTKFFLYNVTFPFLKFLNGNIKDL